MKVNMTRDEAIKQFPTSIIYTDCYGTHVFTTAEEYDRYRNTLQE